MAKDYLFKCKTNRTLYFDEFEGEWTDDKPDIGAGDTLTFIRAGTVLYAEQVDDKDCQWQIELYNNKNCTIMYMENYDDAVNCSWWDLID